MAATLAEAAEPVKQYLEFARVYVNQRYQEHEPWQLIVGTFGLTIILMWLYDFLFQQESLWSRGKKRVFRFVRALPIVKGKVKDKIESTTRSIDEEFGKNLKGLPYVLQLPHKGMTQDEIMVELSKYKAIANASVDWSKGGCSGTVYSGQDDLTHLMAKVYGEFLWTNPLHPDVFPDIRKMEAEVVSMVCRMFRGGPESCGTMTSGGTESIMLACKAYRDMAYENGIRNPEMIVPVHAHAAFDKAAHYFNIFIRHCPVNEKTCQVDVSKMRRMINKNTCMLAGSAPSFPHGIIDPIVDIGKLGKKYNIPVHVDSCLGGFLIPFMKKAGYELEPFDLTVPGVTSISADTHKYGFAPKGSSVVIYSDKLYRKYQYFVAPDWPGGIYACPTFAGSRAGAIIAACWATLMYFGEDGYVKTTKQIIETTRYIEKEVRKIDHIFVYGTPQVSVVGIGSKEFNAYRLSDALSKRGWNLNALQFPSSFHICVTLLHTKPGRADNFVKDIRECVADIMANPNAKAGGMGALYGMAQSIPDRSMVAEITGCFFDAYYSTGTPKEINGKM